MNRKSLFRSVKAQFKLGDKIIFPETRYDADTGFKREQQTGIIMGIYPSYVRVKTKNYQTTVHNHVLLTSKQVRKVKK